jgi:hypothetical protein
LFCLKAVQQHAVNLTKLTPSIACLFQPYRTTPLVLPGAKVKKEAASTSSYLRHHPNPKFRAPPSHYDTSAEVLMKQKVNFVCVYWHYTWSFAMRVLRGIFGPKRDGVTGEWRRLHNEELNDLY